VALVLVRCVRPVDAYRGINWESVVLVAGMLPLATALDRTGATATVVGLAESNLAGLSPYLVLAALAALTSTIGLVISNTATALLVAPVAVRMAEALQIAPEPLLMGVAFAATTAFSTPVASPVNTLVVGPGGYRFADFVRVGLPLQLLLLLGTVVLVPLFFPF
jgi:di/tricarboxylate transporter